MSCMRTKDEDGAITVHTLCGGNYENSWLPRLNAFQSSSTKYIFLALLISLLLCVSISLIVRIKKHKSGN